MENDVTETRYVCSPMADATLAGDRMAIYHRGSRNAITLNPTGTVLWLALAVPRSLNELIRELVEKWPAIGKATAREDVLKFLDQLRQHDMIVEK